MIALLTFLSVAVAGTVASILFHLPAGVAFGVVVIGVMFSVVWTVAPTLDP